MSGRSPLRIPVNVNIAPHGGVNPLMPLLEQARREGYDKGRGDQKEIEAQTSENKWWDIEEKAKQQARIDLRHEIPSRLRWFIAGAVAAFVLVWLAISFSS